MPVSTVHDFNLGIQLADRASRGQIGAAKYCNYLSDREYWSDWATDADRYDPDAIRIHLQVLTWRYLRAQAVDFRIGIQFADDAGSGDFGIRQFTPWASEGGGWSSMAGDDDEYDPDAVRIIIQRRRWPSTRSAQQLKDMRIGLQLADWGGTGDFGLEMFTPWLSNGGGWSEWVMDRDKYDFDTAKVCLEVRLEQVGPVEPNV